MICFICRLVIKITIVKKIIVTGGAGFIGSTLIRYLINYTENRIINVDKLTYASNLESLISVKDNPRYRLIQADIGDMEIMTQIFTRFKPDWVIHLASESHVDRSIDNPVDFVRTNILGTYSLLEVTRKHWQEIDNTSKKAFRFHHVSTDEVFGDLKATNNFFTEKTAYAPSSPYSASKASSDHLVKAWHRTYGLPIIMTHCSNNYGPYQFPEKLIPIIILCALEGKSLPVYGKGEQVRDWLFVEDHVRALYKVIMEGKTGETYNIGGRIQKRNIDVVHMLCDLLEELKPEKLGGVNRYHDLITFVEDRPGHDTRYAIDPSKIERELDWKAQETFESGLRKTVQWYFENIEWCHRVRDDSY